MPTFTVQKLIERAAALADVHDNFVSAQTWLDWFNAEHKALALFKARANWLDGTLELVSITAPTNTFFTVSAPAAILGVWEVATSGRVRRLKRIDRIQAINMSGLSGPANHWYYTRDEDTDDLVVSLAPVPTSGTYVVYHLPATSDITSSSTTRSFSMGEDERIVLGMARRALIKEESDTREIDVEIRRWDQNVEELAWAKSIAEVPHVRNVDSEVRGWASDIILPPFASWYWV